MGVLRHHGDDDNENVRKNMFSSEHNNGSLDALYIFSYASPAKIAIYNKQMHGLIEGDGNEGDFQ